jgi:hypothetical protein
MPSAIFYVDESGDLGWKFDAPYRKGGSSRYLTVATLVCPPNKKHLPKRLITDIYKKFKWDPSIEKKWSSMIIKEKEAFAKEAKLLVNKHSEIKLLSITVFKEKVMDHIRKDSNKLYNYMINLSLIDEMAKYDDVCLIPDPRSIKVESGNSLHDYLGINLAFEKKVSTSLRTLPCNSACSKNVQFVDMLAGLVQGHYEDSNSRYWNTLQGDVASKKLYFP